MFERKLQPLVSRRVFFNRMLRSVGIAGVVTLFSLGIGVLGYHFLVHLSWLDALLNASMILTGMGPVNPIEAAAGKWFASGYALFSGIVFITVSGLLIAPVAHRFFHKFHLEPESRDPAREEKKKL